MNIVGWGIARMSDEGCYEWWSHSRGKWIGDPVRSLVIFHDRELALEQAAKIEGTVFELSKPKEVTNPMGPPYA